MSAKPAYMLFESVMRFDGLIGDARLRHYNHRAATFHGYKPDDLRNMFLSDLQPHHFRQAGRWQHTLRHHGIPTMQEYATVVEAQNGELLGQTRELVYRLENGWHGPNPVYMVKIDQVKELPDVRLPDTHGLTEADCNQACGQLTVRQVRAMHADGTLATHSKSFAIVLQVLDRIITQVYQDHTVRAVDLALDEAACTWSWDGEQAKIRLSAYCPRCEYRWWRHKVYAKTWRCPNQRCGAYLGVDTEAWPGTPAVGNRAVSGVPGLAPLPA